MTLPKMKNKQERNQFCEAHCPQPYTSRDAAVWVADTMNKYARSGYLRGYEWVRNWALEHHIDYGNAYCM